MGDLDNLNQDIRPGSNHPQNLGDYFEAQTCEINNKTNCDARNASPWPSSCSEILTELFS